MTGGGLGASFICLCLAIIMFIDKTLITAGFLLTFFVAYGLVTLIMIKKFSRKKMNENKEPKDSL